MCATKNSRNCLQLWACHCCWPTSCPCCSEFWIMLFLLVYSRELGRRWAQLLRGEAVFSHFWDQFGPPYLRMGSEICWWEKRKWIKTAGRERTEAAGSGWGKEGLKDECWEKQAVSHPPTSSRKVGWAIACCAVHWSSRAPQFCSELSPPALYPLWSTRELALPWPISFLFRGDSELSHLHVVSFLSSFKTCFYACNPGYPTLNVFASTSNWGIAAFPLPKTLFLHYGNILVF